MKSTYSKYRENLFQVLLGEKEPKSAFTDIVVELMMEGLSREDSYSVFLEFLAEIQKDPRTANNESLYDSLTDYMDGFVERPHGFSIFPIQWELKPLTKDGLQTLVGWAREEGWNPGDHDCEAFWAADPAGYVGFYHKDQLIAGGAVVSYGGDFGFMGLFIVHPHFRGKGIGESLWRQRRDLLLSRLKPGAAIGMDGVVAMQPFYEKGGFSIAFRDERYELTGKPFDLNSNFEIEGISELTLDSICTYDAQCLRYDRRPFLKSWLTLPDSHGFVVKEKESILGYAVIRKVGEGHKIGPLFAENASIAEELLKACLNTAHDEKVYFDVAVNHPEALALAKNYGGKYVFECARMYHGNPPATDWKSVFGITTFELG